MVLAGIKDIREKAPINQNGIFQGDMLFQSPSYAAAFNWRSANGLVEWKTKRWEIIERDIK